MNAAYEARIPENLDSFVLGLAWFLFFLVGYFAGRWFLSKLRHRKEPQNASAPIPQVITVYHHHVIEVRRCPDWNTPRSKTSPERDV